MPPVGGGVSGAGCARCYARLPKGAARAARQRIQRWGALRRARVDQNTSPRLTAGQIKAQPSLKAVPQGKHVAPSARASAFRHRLDGWGRKGAAHSKAPPLRRSSQRRTPEHPEMGALRRAQVNQIRRLH